MKEERMAILKMVEDGKLSADDAVKLLEAVSKNKKAFDSSDWQSGLEDRVKTFAKSMDEMGKELGKKLEEVGKDVEPRIKKVAQTVIDKTTECVDEITKAMKKEDSCCCDEEKTEECECCCCDEEKTEEGECCCGCEDEPKEN